MTLSPGEHLMPWFFAFGAAGFNSSGTCLHKEYLGSLPMAAYGFYPDGGGAQSTDMPGRAKL